MPGAQGQAGHGRVGGITDAENQRADELARRYHLFYLLELINSRVATFYLQMMLGMAIIAIVEGRS